MHGMVFSQHVGDEMMHTTFLCDLAEPTKQRCTHPTQVLGVSHYNRNLGTSRCGDLHVIAGDAE